MLESAAAVACHVDFWEEYFICSGCHQKVTNDRVLSERGETERIGGSFLTYIESVERSHYRIFSGFMLELQAVQGYTGEVMRVFIVPLTNGSRCRFVELEVMRKSGVVGSGRGDDVYQLL